MSNIVISYFEPFGGKKTNSSKEVAAELKINANRVCLPVHWDDVVNELDKILSSEPRYLFMLGEAESYPSVQIERYAHNIATGVDNGNNKKSNDVIIKDGPKELETNIDLSCINEYEISHDAGKFLCNYSYYLCLAKTVITKVVFIHIPLLHSKGSRSKVRVVEDVTKIINTIVNNEKGFLVKLQKQVVTISEDNALELYPRLQVEYHYPHLIYGLDKNEDDTYTMSMRVDGLVGNWKMIVDKDHSFDDVKRKLIYQVANFLDTVYHDGRSASYNEKTHFFTPGEYYAMSGPEKKYMTYYVCQADYTNELEFYRSLDKMEEYLIETVDNQEAVDNIKKAKDYISRMGLEKTKTILFRISK